MKLRSYYLIAIALVLAALPAQALTTGFVIGEGPGKLVDSLIAAGYGPENLYDTLISIQADTNPSVSPILTDAFINTLAACPANSPIFTTHLSAYAGNGVVIYSDCTAAATYVQGSGFNGLAGNTTLATDISGVGAGAVVSLGTPFALGDPTHYVFAIIYAPSGPSQSFVLSNKGGQLIGKLLAAGYGVDNLYQTLTDILADTNPSIAGVLTPAFVLTLKYCAAESPIFTTHLQSVVVPVAISDDCSVQTGSLTGSSFSGQPGTTTLSSLISGVGTASLVSSTSSSPLTSWTQNVAVGNGTATVTYDAFAILYTPGSTPSATPALPSLWLAVAGCLAVLGCALWTRRCGRALRG
jgi:hypothetical protein